MDEIITDKNKLEKSLRELAHEKNAKGQPLSQSELEALIACFVPAESLSTDRSQQIDAKKDVKEYHGEILTAAEIDKLLCYYIVSDEPVYEKESIITKIVNKIKFFIPKGKKINDDTIAAAIPDGVVIHRDAYDKVLKNRDWGDKTILTQNEIDELIRQLIEVSERMDGSK